MPWVVPLVVVGIVAILGIVIPYLIISSDPVASYKTFVFIALLIISAMGVSTVRYIEDNTVKCILYLIMGFTVYWIVGATFHGSYLHLKMIQPEDTEYYKLFNTDFIPIIMFAIANAITVLVALIDGRKNGLIFGSMGMGVILFSIANTGMGFVNSRPDVLLLLVVMWALIPSSWVRLLTSTINDLNVSIEKRFYRTFKYAILTGLIYILIGLLTYFIMMGSSTALETFSMAMFIEKYSHQLQLFALSTGYFYVLPNVILIVAIFTVYEFALHAFNLKKEVADDGTITYVAMEKKKKPVAKEEYDPFEDIIKDMKNFKKEFGKGKVNRLVAAQKIGTFREQVDFLNSKYDIGSKAKASEILKEIERESEFAFK